MGSDAFRPTSDRPVGWRGDGTGCFPGATPPLEWGRWAKAATHEIRNQAENPNESNRTKSLPFEFGILKEWMVCGPFAGDGDVGEKEADLEPGAGGKIAWKHFRANIESQSSHVVNGGSCGTANVDFSAAFGDLANQCAYAHAYIQSPSAAKVLLYLRSPAMGALKAYLNGKPLDISKGSCALELKDGWNRLLVKMSSGAGEKGGAQKESAPSKWRFSATLRPQKPYTYASKNIAWITPLPKWSCATPIVVGDKVFVQIGTNGGALICINKADGKILWIRPYSWAFLSGDAGNLKSACDEFMDMANKSVSAVGPDSATQAALDQKGSEFVKEIEKVNSGAGKPRIDYQDGGANNPTPCSDGKHVFVFFGCTLKITACFDLNGKLVWTNQEPVTAWEHGNHGSPMLIDKKLVVSAGNTAMALDPDTGNVIWRVKDQNWRVDAASPVPVTLNGTAAAVLGNKALNVSDGKILAEMPQHSILHAKYTTPCLAGDKLYLYTVTLGNNSRATANAIDITGKSEMAVAWQKDLPDPLNTAASPWNRPGFIASGVIHEKFFYGVDMMGVLFATDIVGGKLVFSKVLDKNQACDRMSWGVCTSPALAGKNLFVTDNGGGTTVLEPGPQYKEIACNTIEQYTSDGRQKNVFSTSFWFEGGRIYAFCGDALFCIGTK